MRAFTWLKSSVCLGRVLYYALVQFPLFTDEQTEATERRDLPQICKLVVELGLEPRSLDSQSLRALSITSLVFTCHFHTFTYCLVLLQDSFLCVSLGLLVI